MYEKNKRFAGCNLASCFVSVQNFSNKFPNLLLQFQNVDFDWLSAIQRSKYFWYVKDYTGEFSSALDWSLGMMFHEEIRDEQGWHSHILTYRVMSPSRSG